MSRFRLAFLFASFLTPALPAATQWSTWQVIGPFEYPAGAGSVEDPQPVEKDLGQLGVDQEGIRFDKSYRGKGGMRLNWTELPGGIGESRATDVGEIRFAECLPPPKGMAAWVDSSVAYLYREFVSEREQELHLNMGSDDGMRLWFNGELLIDRPTKRALVITDHRLALKVKPGRNHLFVKVCNGVGGWAFQMREASRIDGEKIDTALFKGREHLIAHQLLDGSWGHYPEYGPGHTAFVTYTLLKTGLSRDHVTIQRALHFIRSRPANHTYSLSTTILALAALDSEAHDPWLEETLMKLVDFQSGSGMYSYPTHPAGSSPPVDLSNTIFAALAFRAAAKRGFPVSDEIWTDMVEGVLRCQETIRNTKKLVLGQAAAGFRYRAGGGAITGSMTVAGLSILAMAKEALGSRLSGRLLQEVELAENAALNWLERHQTWHENPGQAGHHLFFLYGLERVGSLLGRDRLGGTDWYWDGSAFLVDKQLDNGAWQAQDAPVDTMLAMLFLSRATVQSITLGHVQEENKSVAVAEDQPADEAEVHLRATGDSPLTIWIAGFPEYILDEYRWPTQKADGLYVEKVEYFATAPDSTEAPAMFATVAGNPKQPSGGERFAVRHSFEQAGTWTLRARVHVYYPTESANEAPTLEVLESPDLPVEIQRSVLTDRLDYAADHDKNLVLQAREVRAVASSEIGPGRSAAKTVDGRFASHWMCKADDAEPWLNLAFPRPIRTKRILVTHALPRMVHENSARAIEVELQINGKDRGRHRLNPDVLDKTEIVLEKKERVRSLRLTIKQCRDRPEAGGLVGFSEIELQGD